MGHIRSLLSGWPVERSEESVQSAAWESSREAHSTKSDGEPMGATSASRIGSGGRLFRGDGAAIDGPRSLNRFAIAYWQAQPILRSE